MMSVFLLLGFSLVLLALAVQDWRTTYVSFPGLIIALCLGFLFAWQRPFAGTTLTEHMLGGTLLLLVVICVRLALAHKTNRVSLGEADVWVLTSAGLVLGMQWIGPYLGLSVVLGLLAYPLLKRHNSVDGAHLPFLPFLILPLWVLAWGRLFDLLPARPF